MANTKPILGFIAGAAVGAIAGILLAPASGADTRKKIADKTGDLKDALKNTVSGNRNKSQKAEEGVNTTGDPNVANMHSGAL